MGIPEAIVESVSGCDEAAQPWLYKNIVLTGGCAMFPGFKERLEKEVRKLAPNDLDVVIRKVENPLEYAWRGGASLAKDKEFSEMCVTKQEYMEGGFQACQQKFYL